MNLGFLCYFIYGLARKDLTHSKIQEIASYFPHMPPPFILLYKSIILWHPSHPDQSCLLSHMTKEGTLLGSDPTKAWTKLRATLGIRDFY